MRLFLCLLLITPVALVLHPSTKNLQHGIAAQEPSQDAKLSTARIRLPDGLGLQAELIASEPMLVNPVAFCFDNQGRIYVAEAFRIHEGVTDNRNHMYWLDDDIACQTVADRDAKYRKHLKDKYDTYTKQRDQVRLLIDTNSDGKPDQSTSFAQSENRAVDGLGSGVLAYHGNVYYSSIPDLILLRDTKGQGKADFRQVLSTGYGVHTSFFGHDLHGLVVSPVDGKLYFSIGDRGANIVTKEGKRIEVPHEGAVFRCKPDGSDLELFAKGLRNPQELAFDDFGNLFTGDNNSDSGDRARFVYLPEGADCGWHIGFQYLEQPYPRGPWNSEFMWHPPRADQPAYIVPPVANLGDGPSGLTFYPGTGLSDRYQGHFFMADFRGSPTSSGIRSFAVKPKGAGFELVDSHQFAWGVLATDVEFGPDGGLYILDWIEGWTKTGKGRIHRLARPDYLVSRQAKEIKDLLASDWSKKSVTELGKLLGHQDRRIRMEAQFALVKSSTRDDALNELVANVQQKNNRFARLHAIWALGQMIQKPIEPKIATTLTQTIRDEDAMVVLNALRVLSRDDPEVRLVREEFSQLLNHPDDHVKAQTAICLGRQKAPFAFPLLLDFIQKNKLHDPWLRHACVMALEAALPRNTPINDALLAPSQPAEVQLAVVLAIRRLGQSNTLIRFLEDRNPKVLYEAIRAAYDMRGFPQSLVAGIPMKSSMPQPIQLRILSRCLSASYAILDIARYTADDRNPEKLRLEALKMLAAWPNPPDRDWVTGLWHPIPARSPEPAQQALRKVFDKLVLQKNRIAIEAIRTVEKLNVSDLSARLVALADQESNIFEIREAALQAAATFNAPGLEATAKKALQTKNSRLRSKALDILARIKPEDAVIVLGDVLEHGDMKERQACLMTLAQIKHQKGDQLLESWLQRAAQGNAPAEIHLELLEVAQKHSRAQAWKPLLEQFINRLNQSGPYGDYRQTLSGGDREAGRKLFFEKTEAACLRCHKVRGQGGEVGPDLTHIGKDKSRDYLLESIVDPNKTIAKNFELTIILTTEGVVHQGVVKSEDDKELKLITPEAKMLTIKKADIDDRKTGKSAMPEDAIKLLTLRELRDLIEYLSSLK